MKEFHDLPGFSCPHESQKTPTDLRIPDHVPITEAELVELMSLAMTSSDPRLRAAIQSRLGRAIPDNTCPHIIEGPVEEARTKLDQLFVDELQNGPTDDFVARFEEIAPIAPIDAPPELKDQIMDQYRKENGI